ncbi:MAG: hypothetical protein M1821_008494 [Bathelium mastoideum]|nr:MAG: hypothetical protein M1821_008494 [Bathelium mastoideum]
MTEETQGFRWSSYPINPADCPLPASQESLDSRSEAAARSYSADRNTVGDIDATQIPLPLSDVDSLAEGSPRAHAPYSPQRPDLILRDNVKESGRHKTAIIEPARFSYMEKVRLYASEVPNLGIVSSNEVRFPSAGKLLCYDFDIRYKKPKRRRKMAQWHSQNVMGDFRQAVLEGISSSTYLRLALVEDLSPDLMEVIGSVMDVSPEFFEEHLRNAGYQNDEDKDSSGTWSIDASPKGYASLNWFRPVLPTIRLANFRSSLIAGKGRQASCPYQCGRMHPVELTTNIFRRNWDLSSEPNVQSARSQKAFPTAWEEKMTFCTKQVDNCTIVLLLLDPLPTIRQQSDCMKGGPKGPEDFSAFRNVKLRGPSIFASSDSLFGARPVSQIKGSLIPKSTMKVIEDWIMHKTPEGSYLPPLEVLFTVLHGDVTGLVEVMRSALEDIREKSASTTILQVEEYVLHWRSTLNRYRYELSRLLRRLSGFSRFVHTRIESGSGLDRNPKSNSLRDLLDTKSSHSLVEEATREVKETLDEIDGLFNALRAEMSIADSRRSIAEAESVSKLTEFAFLFVPLTFAASIFSMQIRQFQSSVPLSYFIAASIILLFLSYSMRLAIRSPRLAEFKRKCYRLAREEAAIPDSRRLGTHELLRWAFLQTRPTLQRAVIWTLKVSFPAALVSALFGAFSVPVLLLWTRGTNPGFAAVITVVVIPINFVVCWFLLSAILDYLGFSWKDAWRRRKRILDFEGDAHSIND